MRDVCWLSGCLNVQVQELSGQYLLGGIVRKTTGYMGSQHMHLCDAVMYSMYISGFFLFLAQNS